MAGQVFVFFILTVAAAESAIGLAILVVLFRNRARPSTSKSSTTSRAEYATWLTISQNLLLTVPLAPLAGAIAAGLAGKAMGRKGAHTVTILGVLIAFIGSAMVLSQVASAARASTPPSTNGWCWASW
jgi:hypothetical protein